MSRTWRCLGSRTWWAFRVAYLVRFRVAYLVGFRVAYVVDAWSGSLMLDVAGCGCLVTVAEGDGENPKPGIVNHRSFRIIDVSNKRSTLRSVSVW